jgi:1-acyl-sn-glycerol-3-phosphate acyltransferase
MKAPLRHRLWIGVAAWALRPLANIMMAKEWLDVDKLPKDRGFILCPTHSTEVDPVVVGHMVYNQGIMPYFLAKEGLFRTPLVGTVLRGAGQVPVSRAGATAGKSIDAARAALAAGGAVIIYPEGTLTRDPDLWPMKGHTGAARLAMATGAPVIPVAHWGAQEAFPRYGKSVHLFPRKTVHVLVGDPVDLSRFDGLPMDRPTLAAVTDAILDDMTALLAGLRGEQPPASRWDPAEHKQAKAGRFVERGQGHGTGNGTSVGNDDGAPASAGTSPAGPVASAAAVEAALKEAAAVDAAPMELAEPGQDTGQDEPSVPGQDESVPGPGPMKPAATEPEDGTA